MFPAHFPESNRDLTYPFGLNSMKCRAKELNQRVVSVNMKGGKPSGSGLWSLQLEEWGRPGERHANHPIVSLTDRGIRNRRPHQGWHKVGAAVEAVSGVGCQPQNLKVGSRHLNAHWGRTVIFIVAVSEASAASSTLTTNTFAPTSALPGVPESAPSPATFSHAGPDTLE
jgi:hypothetical protein